MLACGSLLLLVLAPGEAAAATPAAVTGPGTTVAADTTPLSAAVRGATTTTAKSGGSSTGGAFVRLVVGLFIVLAVIYGVYWLLKTYGKSKKNGGGPDAGAGIDVVATTAIGPNKSVHLLRVGDELLLVGSAEHGLTPLRTYSADESRLLEQQLEAAGSLRVLGDSRSGGTPLTRLMDELRKRTLR